MNTGRVPTSASVNNLADDRGCVCGDDPPIAGKSPRLRGFRPLGVCLEETYIGFLAGQALRYLYGVASGDDALATRYRVAETLKLCI